MLRHAKCNGIMYPDFCAAALNRVTMQYNIDFVIGALAVTGVTMAYYFFSPRLNNEQGNIFAAVGLLLLR